VVVVVHNTKKEIMSEGVKSMNVLKFCTNLHFMNFDRALITGNFGNTKLNIPGASRHRLSPLDVGLIKTSFGSNRADRNEASFRNFHTFDISTTRANFNQSCQKGSMIWLVLTL
jgi:hypothetical protein